MQLNSLRYPQVFELDWTGLKIAATKSSCNFIKPIKSSGKTAFGYSNPIEQIVFHDIAQHGIYQSEILGKLTRVFLVESEPLS